MDVEEGLEEEVLEALQVVEVTGINENYLFVKVIGGVIFKDAFDIGDSKKLPFEFFPKFRHVLAVHQDSKNMDVTLENLLVQQVHASGLVVCHSFVGCQMLELYVMVTFKKHRFG